MKKRVFVLLAALLSMLFAFSALSEADRTITVSPENTFVYVKESIKLKAEVEKLTENAPEKTKLVWESSDKKIAKIDSKGSVTGVAPGTVTITCKAKDNEEISQTIEIEVRRPVKSVSLSDSKVTMLFGATEEAVQSTLSYKVSPEDAYDSSVTWSSSDESVVTVDQNGVMTAVGLGKATVTATSNSASSKSATCKVTVVQSVRTVTLNKSAAEIYTGDSLKLKANVLPENAETKKVTWKSSNESAATVDSKGTVKAKGPGKAIITCTATDGSKAEAKCTVTVIRPVKKVAIDQGKRVVLFEDKTKKLTVSITPYDASNKAVRWSSEDSRIASVDEYGMITAKKAGTTTITATARDGSGASKSIKVVVEPTVPISLESIGTGRFLPNLLGLTVKNKTKTMTIKDFDFELSLYTYNGTTINTGSYSLGKNTTVKPGKTKTIKRTASGVGYSSKIVITITGVQFSDGTFYSIPYSERETWSFRVN